MGSMETPGILGFLTKTQHLKAILRYSWTDDAGRQESVAEELTFNLNRNSEKYFQAEPLMLALYNSIHDGLEKKVEEVKNSSEVSKVET